MTSPSKSPGLQSHCAYGFWIVAGRLPAQRIKMASAVNGNSEKYVDFEGHTVRKYDFLQLSKVGSLDFNDPRVEPMIASEVSWGKLL